MLTASQARRSLRARIRPGKAAVYQSFFKTAPGEYGEGDRFIGVTVPDTRRVAHEFAELGLSELRKLLASPVHEERLLSLLILVEQYRRGSLPVRNARYRFYLRNARRVNNWDLVDSSAHHIVGAHLAGKNKALLSRLARSKNLWERRIAVVATWHDIRRGEPAATLKISAMLLDDPHDLIHKACGWMLREVGKRDKAALVGFLNRYRRRMPRTMLRYAIERFGPSEKARFML